jgi:hypothetical protein
MVRVDVPVDSIYFWMYNQGLRHVPIDQIVSACACAGKDIRPKDFDNYWRGYYKADLYRTGNWENLFKFKSTQKTPSLAFLDREYDEYPVHPYASIIGRGMINERWVQCNKDNKPMIKWGNGCMMLSDAVAYKDQVYLAENLKGTRYLVIDCDGNHDGLDLETMFFLNRWRDDTHCIVKPEYYDGVPTSFHLTFMTDRIIPTMHFPYAHIDIIGNRRNSLRYWKNKKWNHVEPIEMTSIRWEELKEYIEWRKDRANA